jgi:hypothetical protein
MWLQVRLGGRFVKNLALRLVCYCGLGLRA